MGMASNSSDDLATNTSKVISSSKIIDEYSIKIGLKVKGKKKKSFPEHLKFLGLFGRQGTDLSTDLF